MNATTLILIAVSLLVVWVLWWWFVARNIPKYPPIDIAEDDPAMLNAIDKARASLDRFRELYSMGMKDVQVKIPFKTNAGETEHLWAEVLSLNETTVSVRYLTPPVSHTGKLERLHEHPISIVEDWVAFAESGDIYGGYTQRVMFERGRELWGALPPEFEKQESRYVA